MNIPTPAEVHTLAVYKGWYDPPAPTAMELLALVHSEVSEAVEELRDPKGWRSRIRHREDGKPEGLPFELADIVLRVFDLADHIGVDIEAAIDEKHCYNATRPHRHGGKLR